MTAAIEQAVTALADADELTLYAKLGHYVSAYSDHAETLAVPGAALSADVPLMGPLDDATELGKRILQRWNVVLYSLVCGGEDVDPAAKKDILKALKIGTPDALAAAITGILIATFSVGPAVATIVGVLLGRILLPAAGQEVCSFWKERI